MRRAPLVAVLLLVPAVAHAQGVAPVIGGHASTDGKWPDALAVMIGGQQSCTGVLIAPTLALTAGHCADPSLDSVLIGANKLSQPQQGESIPVMKQVEYPNSQQSVDITLLVLAHPSTRPPRTIATGWARFDIANGATVAIVGWGATDMNAQQYPDAQQEAMTTITDADCTNSSGCNAAAKPNGELGAGGGGTDTCPGDSGGPLYLVTSYGTFLAGTTSRSYGNATAACKEGGIYERPDKIIDWIQQQSGVTLPVGPMPTADMLEDESGKAGTALITTNDPKQGAKHTFTIGATPAHGTATVSSDGVVTYTSVAGYLGADEVAVTVADTDVPARTLSFKVGVDVIPDKAAPGCGCQSNRPSAGGLAPLFAIGFIALRRKRVRQKSVASTPA